MLFSEARIEIDTALFRLLAALWVSPLQIMIFIDLRTRVGLFGFRSILGGTAVKNFACNFYYL